MNSTSKERKSDGDMARLYKTHGDLTDKKILGTITPEEEKELGRVRSGIEAHEQGLTDFYQNKIVVYQKILAEMEKARQSI